MSVSKTIDSVTSVGMLALIAGGAYLIWAKWGDITASLCRIPGASLLFGNQMCPDGGTGPECPSGYTKNSLGQCIIDPVDCPDGFYSEFGICKPYPDQPQTCPTGQIWDFILKRCVTPTSEKKQCPDGSWVYDYQTCPTVITKPCVLNNGRGGDYFSCEDGSQVCQLTDCQEQQGIFGCSDKNGVPTKTRYINGQWQWLDVPCIGSSPVTCSCSDGGITIAPAGTDCVTACNNRAVLPATCREIHDRCAPLQIGAGSGFGFKYCPPQYPIELSPGVCINSQQQKYLECMGDCI